MSRLRTIYNNEALLVGPSPSTGTHSTGNIKKLHRVQSIGNSVEVSLENINEYGKMAAIDRMNLDGGTNSLEFSHLNVDFENELNLGFVISSSSSAIGNIANKTSNDKNYFRYVAPEGVDAVGSSAAAGAVLALGNGFIGSYSFEAAVGSFPTSTVGVQGLNTASYPSGSTQALPSVDPSTGRKASGTFTLPTIPESSAAKPSVIRPGDVKVTFSNPAAGLFQTLDSTLNVQSASFNFDLNLEPLNKLGSRLAVSREIQYPIDIQISVEALMGDLTANTGLVDFLCNSPSTDITIDLYKSTCDSGGPTYTAADIFAKFTIKKAKLNSQDLSGSIGPSDTVSMQFTSQVGASNDTVNGLFFSGVTGYNGVTALKSA
jgi:hypothetical protein